MNATRLLVDPDIEEAIEFRNSIAEHGSIDVEPLAVVLDSSRQGLEANFIKNNPKKTISQLTSISEEASAIGYPQLLHSLIGKRMLFKVETKLEQAFINEGAFPVIRVCCDETIISMFDLIGAETTPLKAVFVPPFTKVDTEVMDLKDDISQPDSEMIGTCVSLGDSHVDFQSPWTPANRFTPAKRMLDDEFAATQKECSVNGLKKKDECSVSCVNKNTIIDVENYEVPYYAPVSVKLEKP